MDRSIIQQVDWRGGSAELAIAKLTDGERRVGALAVNPRVGGWTSSRICFPGSVLLGGEFDGGVGAEGWEGQVPTLTE